MIDQTDTNAAARAYLTEYCDPARHRDFAVLLTGPWGAGKTFFAKNFLEPYKTHLYISLYGISASQQIDEEIYRQLHPILSSKTMTLLGRVGKGLLRGTLKIDLNNDGVDDGNATIGIPDLGLFEHLSDPADRLLVFDDLERCSMPISDVLESVSKLTLTEPIGGS
ncbi:MAG: P-loop NTPase fold protein [Flammeovirgaceae bacterium]